MPPELWRLVVQHLSKDDMAEFLCVCRLFRDVVLPVLFSHVTVEFGLWRPEDPDIEDETPGHKQRGEAEEIEEIQEKTCEVLFHTMRTPSFARVIKKLSVRAYFVDDSKGILESCEYSRSCIALPHA